MILVHNIYNYPKIKFYIMYRYLIRSEKSNIFNSLADTAEILDDAQFLFTSAISKLFHSEARSSQSSLHHTSTKAKERVSPPILFSALICLSYSFISRVFFCLRFHVIFISMSSKSFHFSAHLQLTRVFYKHSIRYTYSALT